MTGAVAPSIVAACSHAWIGMDDPDGWDAVVAATQADVFHQAWFHRLAMERGEGVPRLFVWRTGRCTLILPLLLREIPGGAGIDATSVYGYVGPAWRGNSSPGDAGLFRDALAEALRSLGVVSVFSRLHPLSDASVWLSGLGQLDDSGTTVSVALEAGVDPRRHYRGSHRREIARLQREGYRADREGVGSIGTFADLYDAAMRRVGAGSRYSFSRAHMRALVEDGRMQLIVVRKDDEPAAAGLFTSGGVGGHYFLSGTHPEHRRLAPSKMLVDAGCGWARDRGLQWMHLGGGVGGACDSLFRFKAGFSPRRHTFRTWRCVLDAGAYRAQCERVGASPDGNFFPAYREWGSTKSDGMRAVAGPTTVR